jgi:capsule polysaccharide export protein KpsE/RkpR
VMITNRIVLSDIRNKPLKKSPSLFTLIRLQPILALIYFGLFPVGKYVL